MLLRVVRIDDGGVVNGNELYVSVYFPILWWDCRRRYRSATQHEALSMRGVAELPAGKTKNAQHLAEIIGSPCLPGFH